MGWRRHLLCQEPLNPPAPPVTTPPIPSSAERHFEVYNLGEDMNILQSADKLAPGWLSIAGGQKMVEDIKHALP